MKLRIKYSKLGNLRFIGHLDVMRYFQKEIRRARLDVSYSQGFSPHQIMSFAAPLAMGITSDGEYFDAEFNSVTTSTDMINALNSVSVDEMRVTECVMLEDSAKNAMSVVAASDYVITFRSMGMGDQDSERGVNENLAALTESDVNENRAALAESDRKVLTAAADFMEADSIMVMKKTKKSERMEDIKPGIRAFELRGDSIYMLLDTGSLCNLKPELVMEALYASAGVEHDAFAYHIHRCETYMTGADGELVPLYEAGKRF